MKYIAVVANNYGKTYDGVGAFSKEIVTRFSSNIVSDVYTSNCNGDDGIISRLLTLGMTKCLLKLSNNIKKYDTVIIEYPFVEWNPIIVFAFTVLNKQANENNKKVILSLHEYDRVNFFRRIVIDFFVKRSNLVLVSNIEMLSKVKSLNQSVKIREIPTNISGVPTTKNRSSMQKFVFFGLINKAKAFGAMIEGWKKFNHNGTKTLYIISSTRLDDELLKGSNIVYIHNADNDAVFKIMNECMFCILPIIPVVDEKNATFKTALLAGCICIGRFARPFLNKGFLINMNKYSKNDFYESFLLSQSYTYDYAMNISLDALRLGERYSPNIISRIVESYI